MDRVVKEGKALGVYRVTVIGGEPLIRWRDIKNLAQNNRDILFTVMTNGTLLTQEIAEQLATAGNVELLFSIDGFQKTNDHWRTQGTYPQILTAMQLYRSMGGMVLYSPTVTTENYEEVFSDAFLDLMIAHGAYMGYYHHYYLVGGQKRSELLLNTTQLRWIEKRIQEIIASKPILIFDNVLSCLLTGGCQAVKEYVHINHRGGVEPCCMVPFAVDNIHEKPLSEILNSRFFRQLKEMPAEKSGIKRCLVGGNAALLKECVEKETVATTTPQSNEIFSFIHT
jgi:MoaA/NifB/PqqE/SkfB family radical SAM enzyme